jgi:hypothetical protein
MERQSSRRQRLKGDEVLRIHKEVFYGALKSQNYTALEELYSDDYMLARCDGSVLNKQGSLARPPDERVDVSFDRAP